MVGLVTLVDNKLSVTPGMTTLFVLVLLEMSGDVLSSLIQKSLLRVVLYITTLIRYGKMVLNDIETRSIKMQLNAGTADTEMTVEGVALLCDLPIFTVASAVFV